jgi:hypothetical protein
MLPCRKFPLEYNSNNRVGHQEIIFLSLTIGPILPETPCSSVVLCRQQHFVCSMIMVLSSNVRSDIFIYISLILSLFFFVSHIHALTGFSEICFSFLVH